MGQWQWSRPKPLKRSRQKKRRGKKWLNPRIGYFSATFAMGTKAIHPEWGYVIRSEKVP
jgi:hypothetical protein